MKRLQQTDVSIDFSGRDKYHASMYLDYPALNKAGDGSDCKFYCFTKDGKCASSGTVEEIRDRLQAVPQIAEVSKAHEGLLRLELAIAKINITSIIEFAKAIADALDIPHSGIKLDMIRQTTYVRVQDESKGRNGWIKLRDYLNKKHFK